MVNYGMDKLKFGEAVRVNDEIRLRTTLKSLLNLRGISKTEIEAVMEIKRFLEQADPKVEKDTIKAYLQLIETLSADGSQQPNWPLAIRRGMTDFEKVLHICTYLRLPPNDRLIQIDYAYSDSHASMKQWL